MKHVGIFMLGYTAVDLYVDGQSNSGWFDFDCEKIKRPRCVVGTGGDWPSILHRLLHEAVEGAFCQRGLIFCRMGDFSRDSSSRVMLMDHASFSESIADATRFLVDAIPAIKKHRSGAKEKRP